VHHASLADDAALVAQACVAAGQRALKMLARRSAREFAARGLAHAARLGEAGLARRAELLKVAGLSSPMDAEHQSAFEKDAEAVVQIARAAGRTDVVASALNALGFLRSARGDFEGAHEVTLGSAEAARGATPAESVPLIANTAFCLAFIEREIPKARALLDEARETAALHRLSVIDIELGEGLLTHMEGDLAHARAALERALALARERTDFWRQSMAIVRLAMIAVESRAWTATRARAAELREVAAKLGEGSEGPIADAFDALALRGEGSPDGPARLAGAIKALEHADAKAMLAWVLTIAAEMALDERAFGEAEELAARALGAAAPLGKPSALALARAALGRAALGAGNGEAARAHLDAARELEGHPYGISARTRGAVEHLAALSNGGTNARAHAGALRNARR
jgi:hypothetical protein